MRHHSIDANISPSYPEGGGEIWYVRPTSSGTRTDLAYYNSAFCLDPLQSRDMIRQLPHCHHVFHSTCCDEWISRELQRHEDFDSISDTRGPTTIESILVDSMILCPLCRTMLSPESRLSIARPETVYVHDERIA